MVIVPPSLSKVKQSGWSSLNADVEEIDDEPKSSSLRKAF